MALEPLVCLEYSDTILSVVEKGKADNNEMQGFLVLKNKITNDTSIGGKRLAGKPIFWRHKLARMSHWSTTAFVLHCQISRE